MVIRNLKVHGKRGSGAWLLIESVTRPSVWQPAERTAERQSNRDAHFNRPWWGAPTDRRHTNTLYIIDCFSLRYVLRVCDKVQIVRCNIPWRCRDASFLSQDRIEADKSISTLYANLLSCIGAITRGSSLIACVLQKWIKCHYRWVFACLSVGDGRTLAWVLHTLAMIYNEWVWEGKNDGLEEVCIWM